MTDERARGSRRRHPSRGTDTAPMIDTYSINKTVKSDNLYKRYTDWDSSSGSHLTVEDACDDRSSNSYERHAAYVDEVREPESMVRLASPRHKRYVRCETGHATAQTQRGRLGQGSQLMSPTSVNAVRSLRNKQDEVSVRTSITSSRSVTSPERRARNSRYEPASKNDDSTITTKATIMPSVVRTRSKKTTEPVSRPRTEPCREYAHGMAAKSAQASKQSSHQPESEGWPSVESTIGSIDLFRPSQCYSSSVDTLTIASAKPPRIPPRIQPRIQGYDNPTPRADNRTMSPNIFAKPPVKLKQSNTNVSSVTGFTTWYSKMEDDDTGRTLENSIPSALEFIDESLNESASYTSITSKPQHSDMKYWTDLSVRAAIAVMQAKGSEMIAEKAATTVVEAGRKIQLKEKQRDMQQVLRFLATKTSVAVLEAGGNQRVATAVAHAIMTGEASEDDSTEVASHVDRPAVYSHMHRPTGDSMHYPMHAHSHRSAGHNTQKPKYDTNVSELTDDAIAYEVGSEVDRSVMLSHIDRSISQKMQKSRSTERARDKANLRIAVGDEVPEKNDCSDVRLPASSTVCTKSVKNTTVRRNERAISSKQGDIPSDENVARKVPEKNSPNITIGEADRYAAQDPGIVTNASKNSLLASSHSNSSTKKHNQQQPEPEKSITPRSLAARERSVEDAAKLNAQREQEINEKMAALDAATAALLARASNVQHFIDQQVAQQQASRLASSSIKEHQTVVSGDDPGYHHNFNGKSVQVDDQYRHHPVKPGHHKEEQQQEKSVFEKLTNQITQMFEFTACATPTATTATPASSANFSYRLPPYTDDKMSHLNHLNCHGGTMGTEYSEAYTYSDRNDDMISALTEDVPVQKKWHQHSRLGMVTNSKRVNEYEEPQPHATAYPTSPLQDILAINKFQPRIAPPIEHGVASPPPVTTTQAITTNAEPNKADVIKQRRENMFPPTSAHNVASPTSIDQALNNAMRQLSSQLIVPEPFNDSEEVAVDATQKQSKPSGIGKLKSAFSRKKTSKSVTFGVITEDLPHNKEPKSPGRMFGGLGRKKGFEKSEF